MKPPTQNVAKRIALALSLLSACRRGEVADASTTTATPSPTMRATAAREDASRAAAPVAPPEVPSAPWCARVLAPADARAIDPHGHLVALRNGTIVDETAHTPPERLPPAHPACTVRRNHLAFTHDGSGAAIVEGRVYFRARGTAAWVASPACSDLGGEPWAPRTDGGGWALVGRRHPGTDPALLMTEDSAARIGWYAVTALDPTMTGLSLEGGGSFVALTAGGHAILVDRERHVAGEVLAANDVLWPMISRSDSGLVLARDESTAMRDLVLGTTVVARFERQHRPRPAGPRTLAVYAAEYGRLLAATDRGVEWSPDARSPFVEVARWTVGNAPESGEDVSMGWLGDGSPALVTTRMLVARRCPPPDVAQ
jgi:hypothetical protein